MGKKYTADTFEGAVTGTASGNVAKTGDTMTGNLTIERTDTGEAGITLFSNNNTQTTSTINFKVKNPMSSTPYSRELSVSNSGFTFDESLTINNAYNSLKMPNGRVQIGPSTSSNTIGTYEIGTWIPELTTYQIFGSPAITNQSYSVRTGKYLKIGSMVRLEFAMELSATITYTNRSIIITGLPFNFTQGGYRMCTGNINYYDKLKNMELFAGLGFAGNSNNVFGLNIQDTTAMGTPSQTRNYLTSDLMTGVSSMTPIRIHGSFIYRSNQI